MAADVNVVVPVFVTVNEYDTSSPAPIRASPSVSTGAVADFASSTSVVPPIRVRAVPSSVTAMRPSAWTVAVLSRTPASTSASVS